MRVRTSIASQRLGSESVVQDFALGGLLSTVFLWIYCYVLMSESKLRNTATQAASAVSLSEFRCIHIASSAVRCARISPSVIHTTALPKLLLVGAYSGTSHHLSFTILRCVEDSQTVSRVAESDPERSSGPQHYHSVSLMKAVVTEKAIDTYLSEHMYNCLYVPVSNCELIMNQAATIS